MIGKMEAAKQMYFEVLAYSNKNNLPISLYLCESRVCELTHETYQQNYYHKFALVANARTVYRMLKKNGY
jgi:hypothetical protein